MDVQPRDAQEAWAQIRANEVLERREAAFARIEDKAKKLFDKDDGNARSGTTNYAAVQVTDTFKVGHLGTKEFYHVRLTEKTCTCPSFAYQVDIVGQPLCKHLLGLMYWFANHQYRIAKSGRVVWGKKYEHASASGGES